jgi:hypothetical protein
MTILNRVAANQTKLLDRALNHVSDAYLDKELPYLTYSSLLHVVYTKLERAKNFSYYNRYIGRA